MHADKLIAHRGWQQRYPENTLIAIEQAIAVGARNIEVDIQFSAEKIPVLCHDQDLYRLSGQSLNINDCTLEQLEKYSAHEPQRLGDNFLGNPFCTLQQCLQLVSRHPQVTLYIEIKKESIRHFGRKQLLKHLLTVVGPFQNQCVLISFDFKILELAVDEKWLRTGPILKQWQQLSSFAADQPGIEVIFCNYTKLPDTLTSADLAYPLAVYEVDRLELACELLQRGASLIETFAIGEMIECID